jgi:hypothetical protein
MNTRESITLYEFDDDGNIIDMRTSQLMGWEEFQFDFERMQLPLAEVTFEVQL